MSIFYLNGQRAVFRQLLKSPDYASRYGKRAVPVLPRESLECPRRHLRRRETFDVVRQLLRDGVHVFVF